MSLRNFLTITLVLISTACFAAETAAPTTPASNSKAPGVEGGDKKTDQKKAGKNGKNGKQNAKGKSGGRGKGGGKVCKADRDMYCKGINGRPERRACLLKNKDILSAGCKEFVEKQNSEKNGQDKKSAEPASKIGTNKNIDKVEVNKAPVATTPATAVKPPVASGVAKDPAKK